MGLIDNTLGRFGYQKQAPEVVAKTADYSGAFNSSGFSTGFITFNNKKQQLNSYEDWVYIAARTVAEECATIELRAFMNRTKMKSAMLGGKIVNHPKTLRKYFETTTPKVELNKTSGLYEYKGQAPLLEEIETHPLLELLNSPNPFMTKNEFMEITFLHLELTGNSYWAILERKGNTPTQLFPLMPNQMSIVADKDKFISGYVYKVNGVDIPFNVDDIIHHKYANPTDMREGYGAVQAGNRVIDTDAHMAEWNRKTMYNDARISGFLTTDTTLDQKVFDRIKDEFNSSYGGTANAYKVALLEGGMDFKQMSLTPKDMDFSKAREFNRDQILALFGVPKSLVGLDMSMSRANAEAAEYAFARYRIKPKMERMANRITQDLAVQFDAKLVISFVDPVPENGEFILQETQAALGINGSVPYVTINEERAKRGDPLIPGGDDLLVPQNYVPLGRLLEDPEEQDAATGAQEDIDNAPQGTDDDNNDANSSSGSSGSGSGSSDQTSELEAADNASSSNSPSSKSFPAFPKSTLSEAAKSTNPKVKVTATDDPAINQTDTNETPMLHTAGELDHYLVARNRLAAQFEIDFMKTAREQFNDQKQQVMSLVNLGFKGQEFNKLNKKQQKAALGDLFSRMGSAAKWLAALTPLYTSAADKSADLALAVTANPEKYGYEQPKNEGSESGNSSSDNKEATGKGQNWNADINEYFTNRAATISKGIDDETDKQLRASLTEGVNAGEDRQGLLDRVEAVYSAATGYRADRIGRTESQTALNYASAKAWNATGLIANYIWLTSVNPCPICTAMEYKVARTPDSFSLGNPPVHPNCACVVTPYQFNDGRTIGNLTPNTDDQPDDTQQ